MEIYVDDTEANIPLTDGPFRPDAVLSVTIDGYPYLPAVVENGIDSPYINLPYKHVQYGGQREVIWTYTVDGDIYTKHQTVDVVSPILPISLIKTLVKPPAYVSGVTELTDVEAVTLEHRVRYAIQDYTGQFFGTFKGSLTGFYDQTRSYFPYRVIEIESYTLPGRYLYTQEEIQVNSFAETEVFLSNSVIGPIDRIIQRNAIVATGLFGYQSVPADVQEAAKILLADYSCNEANYREMYIANVRNADWRFEFRASAWEGTGNATVDAMLGHYQGHHMVVI